MTASEVELLTAQVLRDLALFTYPTRDWGLRRDEFDADVAILGSGYRPLMLALALRTERVDRLLFCDDGAAPTGDRYVGLGPHAALARQDMTGPELSVAGASFPSWYAAAAGGTPPSHGTALATAWSSYIDWLSEVVGAGPQVAEPVDAIDVALDRVTLTMRDGTRHVVRRLVLAGASADVSSAAEVLPGDLAGRLEVADPAAVQTGELRGLKLLVLGDSLAAFDLAITALATGEAAQVVQIGGRPLSLAAGGVAPESLLKHRFIDLTAAQRENVLARWRAMPVQLPATWRDRLVAEPRYRYDQHVDGLLPEELRPDKVLRPAPTLTGGDSASSIPVRCPPGVAATTLAELVVTRPIGANFAIVGEGGTPLPVSVLGSAALPYAGPRAAAENVGRYGVIDVLEALSLGLFVEDQDALYRAFCDFETAEDFGGQLAKS